MLKCGVFDDNFPTVVHEQSVLTAASLREVTFVFKKMSTAAAETLVRFFRCEEMISYRKEIPIKALTLRYEKREREAVLTVLSGILH